MRWSYYERYYDVFFFRLSFFPSFDNSIWDFYVHAIESSSKRRLKQIRCDVCLCAWCSCSCSDACYSPVCSCASLKGANIVACLQHYTMLCCALFRTNGSPAASVHILFTHISSVWMLASSPPYVFYIKRHACRKWIGVCVKSMWQNTVRILCVCIFVRQARLYYTHTMRPFCCASSSFVCAACVDAASVIYILFIAVVSAGCQINICDHIAEWGQHAQFVKNTHDSAHGVARIMFSLYVFSWSFVCARSCQFLRF